MNAKVIVRIVLYALIASIPPLIEGLRDGMTSLDIWKLGLSSVLAACIAVRAFVDTTAAQENSKV